jgi:TatD DNase family protein
MSKSVKPPLPVFDPASFKLPLTGVESHAHLDDQRFDSDRAEVLSRAKAAGIAFIGQVFLSSEQLERGQGLFALYPEVFFLLAIHPNEAYLRTDEELEKLRVNCRTNRRIRAVGETGLDYYWKDCAKEAQKTAFTRLIHLALEVGLPISVHSREAAEDTIEILVAEGAVNHPLVWHCFGGDSGMAERILKLGWHISCPGPVTFPANKVLREAIKNIPTDRLMLETDCPYLAPMPYRGKRNEPAYLALTVQAMAEARGVDAAELWTSCGKTAMKFFGLVPGQPMVRCPA